MSKERARRRAEREREAAIRRAARVAEVERRERRAARRRAWTPRRRRVSRPGGSWAQRRRRQHQVTLLILAVAVGLVFLARPDWPMRLAAAVVAVLAYPVLRTLLFRRA